MISVFGKKLGVMACGTKTNSYKYLSKKLHFSTVYANPTSQVKGFKPKLC
jgi:hypothetical protein